VGPPDRFKGLAAAKRCLVPGAPEETTRDVSLRELARSIPVPSPVNTCACRAPSRKRLLMWLTGRHDVAFPRHPWFWAGRRGWVGADSMIGLLINTVPVRATITATTTPPNCSINCKAPYQPHTTLEPPATLALSEIHQRHRSGKAFSTPSSSTRTTRRTLPHCQAQTGLTVT